LDDRKPMPADGGDRLKGAPDGVNIDNPSGRSEQGESGGGSYPNGRDDRDAQGSRSHGGQSNIGYHGGGQAGEDGAANANAAARGDDNFSSAGEQGPKPGPQGPNQDDDGSRIRSVRVLGRTVAVQDMSGVAAAEVAGTTGSEGQKTSDEEAPGAG
jgi:hypothetical protein